MTNFDFIGDIHGHAVKLQKLLSTLGYKKLDNIYFHTSRKAFFIGDYIDRGPMIPETLGIIRNMVENGQAIALMGNHEYNAICFNTLKAEGAYIRPHTIKNFTQHHQTLLQFQNNQDSYDSYIEWFKTLPIFYETDMFRAVHACWDQEKINLIRSELHKRDITSIIKKNNFRESKIYHALDVILKGKEVEMAAGDHFFDKDGHKRSRIRIKWWLNPAGKSYKDMSIIEGLKMQDLPYPWQNDGFYLPDDKAVFFGHYWLKGLPSLYQSNICCLDYSVAKKGYLVAYRFDGENKLDQNKFVFV